MSSTLKHPLTPAHARSRRLRRGTAVMEAALIFPVLIWISMGSIEFGHYYFTKHSLQGAAREGARVAITPGATNAEVTTAVAQVLTASGFSAGQYTVAIRNAADTAAINVSTATATTPLLIKVSATWGTVGLRPYGFIGTNKQVVAKTLMRKEG